MSNRSINWVSIFILLFSFSNCNQSNFKNSSNLLLNVIDVNESNYYVVLVTDADCSECNIKYIQHWLNSINASSNVNGVNVYILLYSYHNQSAKELIDDFESIQLSGEYNVVYTDSFDLIKNIYLDANKPDGPFALKVIDKKVVYIREIRQPFM